MEARKSKIGLFFPMLFDLFAPIITYYLLHLAGLNDFLALTIGGFVSGINAAVDVVRNRKTKSISPLVFIMFVISIGLVFVTQDARIILVKPSIFIAAAGIYVLSTVAGKPFLVDSMEPFATQGDPVKTAQWQNAWQHSGSFRRRLQLATALSGVLLLFEALARVILVILLPVKYSVIASNIPGGLLMVFFALIGRFYLKPTAEQALTSAPAGDPVQSDPAVEAPASQ
jgi:hypothetical protein